MKPYIFVFLLAATASVSAAQSTRPSLAETEEWITNTFDGENANISTCAEFDSHSAIPTESHYGPDMSCNLTAYSWQFNRCKATLFAHYSHTLVNDAENVREISVPDRLMDVTYQFDLGDIDPGRIKVFDTGAGAFGPMEQKHFHANIPLVMVTFETRNDANKITMIGTSGHPWPENEVTGGFTATPEYGPRFAKAFRNAVELCGGKASVF